MATQVIAVTALPRITNHVKIFVVVDTNDTMSVFKFFGNKTRFFIFYNAGFDELFWGLVRGGSNHTDFNFNEVYPLSWAHIDETLSCVHITSSS